MKDIVDELFHPYVIANIESGSDDGSTTIVDIDIVKKIIKI